MVEIPFVAIPLHQKLIFASELFYKNPILIKPMYEQKKYQESFDKISDKSFSFENLNKEVDVIKKLNQKLDFWLNS